MDSSKPDNLMYNLGGYPPILYISSEDKKKREFTKKMENIDKSVYQRINILTKIKKK